MRTVVLDPGHGGPDTGALAGMLIEKDLNLKTGLLLREYLKAYDVQVFMTRESDTAVVPDAATAGKELQGRCDLANRYHADLFFSIHHDASQAVTAQGGTLYVYGPKSWIPAIGPAGQINHEDPLSMPLAELMLPAFKDGLASQGMQCNGIKCGDFQVLHNIRGPAILVEGFFASNHNDATQAKAPWATVKRAQCYCAMIVTALQLTRQKTPPVHVIWPAGDESWGELRNGNTWAPIPGTAIWVPVRTISEVTNRPFVWRAVPPVVTFK